MAILSHKKKITDSIVNALAAVIPFSMMKAGMPDKFVVYGHLIGGQTHVVSKYYRYPTLAEFDAFLNWCRSIGYRFVGIEEYLKDDGRKKILLTFDDGFKVIGTELHPYMAQNGVPYVIFILTDALHNPEFYIKTIQPDPTRKHEQLFLSAGEILALKAQGVHIGFHTRSHIKIEDVHQVTDERIKTELEIPQQDRHLFSTPLCFANPYLAPTQYQPFDAYMKQNFGYELFFDTKGFSAPDGDHLFRVSIDIELENRSRNWIKFGIKRQLLLFILKRIRRHG